MRPTTIAALVTACALPLAGLTVSPAHAAGDEGTLKKVAIKTVCRDDGKTRVRVRVTVTGDPLVDYTWQIGNGDAHIGDVLLEGDDGASTLVAFTMPAGSRASVTVTHEENGLDKVMRARRC